MYEIWFKSEPGGIDASADSRDLETIQKIWDTLYEAGFHMISVRP